MKRIELIEFEDLRWLPSTIRAGVTNLIMVFHRLMGTPAVIAGLIQKLQAEYHFTQITDLGSGSGGPMIEVLQKVNAGNKSNTKLVLTDYHPNPETVQKINKASLPNVRYLDTQVDAASLHLAPEGLKTMIASFHHMSPEQAGNILNSAQQNKQPILIYEIAKNNIPVLLWCMLLPVSLALLMVMSLAMTPFVRRLSGKQLLLTYLIPVIPLIYAWDGQASLMRTYTFEDIDSLLTDRYSADYRWTIADAKKSNGNKLGYYIIGCPTP